MLDVLDAHAVGAPDEHGLRVRRVDHAVDDAALFRLGRMVVGGIDEHRDVVQQRLVGRTGIPFVELDERAADLDARGTGQTGRDGVEAELRVLVRRLPRLPTTACGASRSAASTSSCTQAIPAAASGRF